MASSTGLKGTITIEEDKTVSISILGDYQSAPPPVATATPANPDRVGAGQCISILRTHPPTAFSVHLSGDLCASLEATVRLREDAVAMLPLIWDLVSSTKQSAGDTTDKQTASFSPPTGIWSLVSLLMLQNDTYLLRTMFKDGALGGFHTVGGSPALAAETLQMADFMGAFPMVEILSGYFTSLFQSLQSKSLCGGNGEFELVHQGLPEIQNMEEAEPAIKDYAATVVWHLPDRFCKDLLTERFSFPTAFSSPDVAFSRWMHGRPGRMTLISELSRHPDQVKRILRCVVTGLCTQITHVQGPGKVLFDCMATGPELLGGSFLSGSLQSLHVDCISLCDHAHGFLALQHPLGWLGMALHSLRIDKVVFTFNAVDEERERSLSSDNLSAAERWVFCRAISRLSSLKRLSIPLACWLHLTGERISSQSAMPAASLQLEVMASLQELEGLVIDDVNDGTVLATVADGKLI